MAFDGGGGGGGGEGLAPESRAGLAFGLVPYVVFVLVLAV